MCLSYVLDVRSGGHGMDALSRSAGWAQDNRLQGCDRLREKKRSVYEVMNDRPRLTRAEKTQDVTLRLWHGAQPRTGVRWDWQLFYERASSVRLAAACLMREWKSAEVRVRPQICHGCAGELAPGPPRRWRPKIQELAANISMFGSPQSSSAKSCLTR